MREKQKDVRAIEYLSGSKIIELAEGQAFYKTPKAWEIWQENVSLPFRVARIPSTKIGFVHTY